MPLNRCDEKPNPEAVYSVPASPPSSYHIVPYSLSSLAPTIPTYAHAAIHQGFTVIDLIWNVAPGSSDVSACTVAFIPILASAPLITPHGNHRNCIKAHKSAKLVFVSPLGMWERRGIPYRLCAHNSLSASFSAHSRERPERIISQDVNPAMVSLEVINLLSKDQHPQVLAKELNHIQRIREPWPISRESAPHH